MGDARSRLSVVAFVHDGSTPGIDAFQKSSVTAGLRAWVRSTGTDVLTEARTTDPFTGGGGVQPGTVPLMHAATEPPLLNGGHALPATVQQLPSMYVTTEQLLDARQAAAQSSTV